MNIAQINAVYHSSSTGKTTEEMHEFLKSEGHNSYVFSSPNDIDTSDVYRFGPKVTVKLHSLLDRIFGIQGLLSIFSTFSIIRRLRKNDVHIVILRNLHSSYINLPILLGFLAKRNITTVAVMHDCWFFTGTCCYYTDCSCDKWKSECKKCPKYHNGKIFPIYDASNLLFKIKKRFFSKIPLHIVGVSDWITSEASKSIILSNAMSFRRIYNWIDSNIYYPREIGDLRKKHGIEENEFVILGVAHVWLPYKGLNILKYLAEKLPKSKIIIIGYVPDEIINEFCITNTIFIGTISNSELLAMYYSTADVFVNCCTQETFGKVSAEALSCGTPVITNSFTANPELVSDSCGYIVESNSPESYLEGVKNVMSLGKKNYSENCIAQANKLFNMQKNLHDYMNLFSEIKQN